MKAYLKWYYGYQNFWDELLFLGLINYLDQQNNIDELLVETRDPERLAQRVEQNKEFISPIQKKLKYIQIPKSKIAKLKAMFSRKLKSYHKFFGGGEVLNVERSFPHDWRNLYFWYRLRKPKTRESYTLLWGIGKANNTSTQRLYKKLLPHAAQIILREKNSYQIVKHFLEEQKISPNDAKLILHEDFSLSVLQQAQKIFSTKQEITHWQQEYILINLNKASYTKETIDKIIEYNENYNRAKPIFFPCDMQDDAKLFDALKDKIPKLELYDRTQHSLIDTLSLFYHAKAWIWARLHFLYPLKIFNIPFWPIIYKDKVRKLILED